jgi:hypothetical protein
MNHSLLRKHQFSLTPGFVLSSTLNVGPVLAGFYLLQLAGCLEPAFQHSWGRSRPGFLRNGGHCTFALTNDAIIPPVYPLLEEFNVMRPPIDGEEVQLEDQGLLGIKLNFNISDRKSIGVKTKGRQLTMLYKIEIEPCAPFFSRWIKGFLNVRELGRPLLNVTNTREYVCGKCNGVEVEAVILHDVINRELRAAGQLGSVSFVEDEVLYLQVLSHALYVNYLIKKAESGVQFQENNIDVALLNWVQTGITDGTINEHSYLNHGLLRKSQGIYLLDVGTTSFLAHSDSKVINGNSLNKPLLSKDSPRSRLKDKPVVEKAAETASLQTIDETFKYFKEIPMVLTLAVYSPYDVAQAGFKQDKTSFANLSSSDACQVSSLIIEEREVTFSVSYPVTPSSLEFTINPTFDFSYYQNNERVERCYVKPDFLGSALQAKILQFIQKTHCSRVTYKSITFSSFSHNDWEDDGKLLRKTSITKFSELESFFKFLIVGQNPIEYVTTASNIMFTPTFHNLSFSTFKPNRFITCSVYKSNSEVVKSENMLLWEKLEKGFSEPIVLCEKPSVRLIPCMQRGPVFEVTKSFEMRGLVSNAGTPELNNVDNGRS